MTATRLWSPARIFYAIRALVPSWATNTPGTSLIPLSRMDAHADTTALEVRVGWSSDTTFTDAELSRTGLTGQDIEAPGTALEQAYFGLWVAAAEVARVHDVLFNGDTFFGTGVGVAEFVKANSISRTIGGVSGVFWRSEQSLDVNTIEAFHFRVVLNALTLGDDIERRIDLATHGRLQPPGGALGDVLTKRSGTDFASEWKAPAGASGGAGHWYEMAQYLRTSAWTSGTAVNMSLRTDGTARFENAAAVRAAVGDGTIPMLALQRSTDDEIILKPIAPNFSDPDASDDYRTSFFFQGASNTKEHVRVRFKSGNITLEPGYADPGVTTRFDLAVFAAPT